MSTAADTTALLWTNLQDGYALRCSDLNSCSAHNCSCLADDACPASVTVDEPCTTAGATCDLIDNINYTTIQCQLRTIVTPPPPPSIWENTTGFIESCLDHCGTTSCRCIHNQCPAGTATEVTCGSVGASCNLIEGPYYEPVTCVAQ